jgi:hypothetical protein
MRIAPVGSVIDFRPWDTVKNLAGRTREIAVAAQERNRQEGNAERWTRNTVPIHKFPYEF